MNKKFRAWDKRNGWMDDEVYIDCIGNVYDRPCVTYDTPNIEIELIENYILEQWTGLTDKNKKPVYEGDVFKHQYGVVCVVEYLARVAGYVAWGSDREQGCYLVTDEIEVIGNIHNDKNLLDNIS